MDLNGRVVRAEGTEIERFDSETERRVGCVITQDVGTVTCAVNPQRHDLGCDSVGLCRRVTIQR